MMCSDWPGVGLLMACVTCLCITFPPILPLPKLDIPTTAAYVG